MVLVHEVTPASAKRGERPCPGSDRMAADAAVFYRDSAVVHGLSAGHSLSPHLRIAQPEGDTGRDDLAGSSVRARGRNGRARGSPPGGRVRIEPPGGSRPARAGRESYPANGATSA